MDNTEYFLYPDKRIQQKSSREELSEQSDEPFTKKPDIKTLSSIRTEVPQWIQAKLFKLNKTMQEVNMNSKPLLTFELKSPGKVASNKDVTTSPRKLMHPLTLRKQFLMNNPDICASAKNIRVLILVHSATYNIFQRQNIRTTYGYRLNFVPSEVRVVFLLGLTSDPKVQQSIISEQKLHGDIVQGNFIDSYKNLTHKAIMGLKWITAHCQNTQYVIKVDDDVVFNTYRFLQIFSRTPPGNIWCDINENAPIHREGKWEVDVGEFEGQKSYPWPYCNGFVVILKSALIPQLYKLAFSVPFFWIDDVYVYGLLLSHIKEVRLSKFPAGLKVSMNSTISTNCLTNKFNPCNLLATCVKKDFMVLWHLLQVNYGPSQS